MSEPALRREAPSKPVESLTAIYINYNSGSRLRNSLSRLLQTLADTLPENRWKVVVWDNASGDGSADDLPCGPRLIVRHSEENVGFAAAIQNATAISPGDAYLILNPDVTIEGHSINTLIDRLNAYGNCGAVSPLLIDTAGAPQFGFSIRALPTIGQMLKEAFGIARILEWFGFSRSRLEDDPIFRDALLRQVRSAPPYYSADQIVEGAQPAAACVLIRAEAFNELGGFDSGFRPAWFEDVDFFARMSRSRWCAALDPSVSAVHEGGYSLSTLSPTEFIGIFYKNMLRYWSKHGTTTERRVARIALPFAAWCRICITFVLREKFKKNNLNREHQTFVGAVRAATRTAWEMFRYRPSLHLSQTGTTYGEAESVNTRASA